MSENNAVQSENVTLNDDLVAVYLEQNTEFFNRHPELLTSLRVNDTNRGVISLVERQQQMLRQKIHTLEEEITQLMTVASHNENLFAVYSDLYLSLMDAKSLPQLLDLLKQTVTELLSLADLKLWLKPEYTVEDSHDSLLSDDGAEIMSARLVEDEFYFGRLQQKEQSVLFSEQMEGSVVLIKLCHQDTELGFLAIGSQDAEHFDPRMDTLLISQFRKVVAKLVSQFVIDQ